jgi:hypothetical protein
VKTFHHFAQSFFGEKQVMPSKYGLETLVDISKSRFALYINKLVLGPALNDQGDVRFERPMDAMKKKKIFSDMKAYSRENRYMREVGLDTCLLLSAFESLRNCTKLEINPHSCDPFYVVCQSYRIGQKHASQKTGNGLAHFYGMPIFELQSLARLFTVSLHAAQTARLPLEEIVAYGVDEMQEDIMYTGFSSLPLELPVPMSGTKSAFAELRVLKITVAHRADLDSKDERQNLIHWLQ